MRHSERGQVLPLWAGAIVTTLMFAFLAVNYGNTVRYQIRAQNAADSVAQGLMALQAERFNKLEVALYTSGVEEYRLRHILDGILLAANDTGGCQDSYASATWDAATLTYGGPFLEGTCAQVYHDLTLEYSYSLNRYTTDAKLVNDFSSYSTYANWVTDTNLLLTHVDAPAHCNSASPLVVEADGTDCAFKYHILAQKQRTGLLCVQQDAQNILVPGLTRTCPSIGADTENAALFAPAQIDVVSCAEIPPIVPNFGPLHAATQYAIGRAAATTVQFEEDWLQPGALDDPVRPSNTFFQPQEAYTNFAPGSDTSEVYNWYGVDFGGNAGVAYVNYGVFNQPTYDNEFSVRMGWWNSIAIKPFATADTMAQACT
jgi:Putative Flp pilus-assembly TadE/G-like